MKTNTGGGGQLFTLPSEGRGWAGYFLLSSPTSDLNHGDSLMRGGYMIDHVCYIIFVFKQTSAWVDNPEFGRVTP